MSLPAKLASRRLMMELASDFSNLESAVERTQAFVASLAIEDDLAYRVVLLVSEAVTNAMEHGNRLDPAKKVQVEISVSSGHIEVVVEDEGPGFDRNGIAHPLDEENRLGDSGRGLFLMEHMADEICWEHGGCRLRMLFNCAA